MDKDLGHLLFAVFTTGTTGMLLKTLLFGVAGFGVCGYDWLVLQQTNQNIFEKPKLWEYIHDMDLLRHVCEPA